VTAAGGPFAAAGAVGCTAQGSARRHCCWYALGVVVDLDLKDVGARRLVGLVVEGRHVRVAAATRTAMRHEWALALYIAAIAPAQL